mmetsp:Transcript_695/g.1829  ORF Transcript_695/g.1829 Transcript_695/m.1829 type:complete len:332 (-) Transcript_695:515-1510(-)
MGFMETLLSISFFARIILVALPNVDGTAPDPQMTARLRLWGSNQYGQLGYDGLDSLQPNSVRSMQHMDPASIQQLALGGGHSLALDNQGKVWSWGWNAKGQLGRRTNTAESCDILPVHGLPPCQKISAGHEESFSIDLEGRLWAFGQGRWEPYTVADHLSIGEQNFKDVDGGVFHAAAVTENGACFFWGKHGVVCHDDEGAMKVGQNPIRWEPKDGSRAVQVACGWKHTVILDNAGRVWGVGSNKHGQLGSHSPSSFPTPRIIEELNDKKILKIDAGWSHTVVLYEDRTLKATGRNNFGQCSTFKDHWEDVFLILLFDSLSLLSSFAAEVK